MGIHTRSGVGVKIETPIRYGIHNAAGPESSSVDDHGSRGAASSRPRAPHFFV